MTTSNKYKIIGLAGTLAAGKDTVGNLLSKKHGYLHVSTGDALRAEKKRVFGDSPEALLVRNDPYANKLRTERGPGVLVELAYEEYKRRADEFPGGLIASGIRSIGEAEKIKELGGIIVFVDADSKLRYERITGRGRDVNDSGVTYEQFMAMEKSESDVDPVDKTIQNIPAMKDRADIILDNNGSDLKAFEDRAEEALGLK